MKGEKNKLKISRRDYPRYKIENVLPVLITNLKNQTKIKGQTLTISQLGISVKLDAKIPVSEKVNVEINLTNSKNVVNKGRVIWYDERNNIYGVDFSECKEKISEYWNGYITGIESIEVDRRKEEERRKEKDLKTSEQRKIDRRVDYPFFRKVKKYSRIKNMMKRERYFFLREMKSGAENKCIFNEKEYVNFASNNYLGLATHPEVIEAGIKAIEMYGVGAGGVRVLSGTMDLHNELEKKLAKFKGGEDCAVFSTGYNGNVGILSCLANMNDMILIDEKSHASLIDGCILSKAQMIPFRHNDMNDLQRKLDKNRNASKLIATDGVFSMDGDMAPVDKIYEIGEKYSTPILVDDAHGTGVLGNGRGTVAHFGLEGKISLNVGTLSKALGGLGGFVVANKDIIHYLKHVSRAFLFSTSLSPANCAATIKAIDIIENDQTLLTLLWKNINYVKKELLKWGFNLGDTQSSVIPVIIGDDLKTQDFVKILESHRVFVNIVIHPAVKKKESRARISVMATHTMADIEILLNAIIKAGKTIGVI